MNIVRALMSQRVASFFRNFQAKTPTSSRLVISRASLCGIIPLTFTHNPLYGPGPGAVSLRAEPVCQVSQRQQAIGGERAPSGRDYHERVRRSSVGPPGWQREQLPVLVVQVDPVLTQFWRCSTNSKSRPASGWNGCVTRTRRYRSCGSDVVDDAGQRDRGTLGGQCPA